MDYPTALSQYGSEIELHADKTPVLLDIIRKGHVMFLQTSLARKKTDFTTVPKMLGAVCESRHIKWTLNSLRSVVWRMVQDLRKLKNKDRDDLLVKARFHELFIFPEQNTSNPAVSPDSSAPDSSAPDSEYSPPSLADFPINPLNHFSVHYWHSPARQCEWETERASPYMSTYPVFNIQVNIFVKWASEVFS